MRVWAATETITFDECAAKIGKEIEVSFGIVLDYIASPSHSGQSTWPCDLSRFGEFGMVMIPALSRTAIGLTGTVSKVGKDWHINSILDLHVILRQCQVTQNSIERVVAENALRQCEALGSLSFLGREMGSDHLMYSKVRILRFQSLCLRANDPRFGQWFDVDTYANLGSDPDVMTARVCIAEIEIPD